MKVAEHYRVLALNAGLESQILDLQQLPANLQVVDCYGHRTEQFLRFQEIMDHSKTLVFVVPEYNGSFPGILKLFIDACDYPGKWSEKQAALVGISAGQGGNVAGLKHLQDVLDYLKVFTFPHKVNIPFIRQRLVNNSIPEFEAPLLAQIRQIADGAVFNG